MVEVGDKYKLESMAMIKKIFIQNYKIFDKFELELNRNLNIIVGDNEVGKSTILEAVNLALTKRLNGRFIEYELTPHLFNKKCVDKYLKSLKEGKPVQLPESICKYISHSWGFDLLYPGTGLGWFVMFIVSSVKLWKAAS